MAQEPARGLVPAPLQARGRPAQEPALLRLQAVQPAPVLRLAGQRARQQRARDPPRGLDRYLSAGAPGRPAAYVSGYLRTIPPPGKPRLQGADATHAWVSLWCGELGWIGFDPTNDILVENDHIVLAVGRDFSDVSPVDGIIVGSRKQKLVVAVDVLLVE